MLGSVLTKSVRDQRRALAWWSVGVAGLVALYVALWPTVRESADVFDQYLERMPEALRAFFGSLDMTSPEGYLSAELFAFMGPLLFSFLAIGAGTRAVAGEEERGTMDLLLSTPLPRWRAVLDGFGSMVVQVAVVAAVMWATVAAGGLLVDLSVSLARMAQAVAASALIGLVFGSMALTLGAWTGRRGTSIGVASALAVATFVVNGLGQTVDGLEPLRPWTPFYHGVTNEPLRNGLGLADAAALVVPTVILVGLALWLFERRDVASR
jgi:ABC-2 type transport system permease protein